MNRCGLKRWHGIPRWATGWRKEFEQRLIEATTLEQLHQAKSKLSTTRRTQIMDVWQTDGRYEWLKAKAARLQTEANAVEQGRLGE